MFISSSIRICRLILSCIINMNYYLNKIIEDRDSVVINYDVTPRFRLYIKFFLIFNIFNKFLNFLRFIVSPVYSLFFFFELNGSSMSKLIKEIVIYYLFCMNHTFTIQTKFVLQANFGDRKFDKII